MRRGGGERGWQKEGMEVQGRVMEKARVGAAGLTEGCVFQGSGVWPGRGEPQLHLLWVPGEG